MAGQVAAASHQLGAQVLHSPALWWAAAGIAITGLMNLACSFYLAFRLALAAHNVTGVDRRRPSTPLGRRRPRPPPPLLLPGRVRGTATAAHRGTRGPPAR